MPVTGLRGRQILDGDVFRNDLNVTTSGSAVIRRIIAGTNITISSTGVDTGTGDVTINAATPTITLQDIPEAWVKDSVRCATTANITLSGTQTIDGIAVVAGDRVLVKDQSTASQNGIYVVAAGAWTRSADANTSSEIAGAIVSIDSGTANGGLHYDTDFKTTDTIDTTAMSWHRVIDTGYGAALTKTDDTNVTLTLGGSPSTALIQATSLTLGWSGQLSVGRGGTGASTLTGVLIGNGTSAFTGVAGTALQLLRRNSGNTAYEFFTGGNITKTDDTNVTLSLGGTPTGSTINSVSFTLGWSGQLSVARGGTGASTLTGVLIGNGTGAVTAVAGTASQLLRRNAGNTAYEFFTHDFASTAGATFTGQIISTRANNAGDGLGQIYLNGATGNRIDFNGNGIAAPALTTRSAGTKIVLFPAVSASTTDYALGIDSSTLWYSVASAAGIFKWYGATTLNMALEGNILKVGGFYWSAGVELIGSDGTSNYIKTGATLYIQQSATTLATADNTKFDFKRQIQSTLANSTTTGGGQIYLNGATGNRIDFNVNGVAAPAFTTRSAGTKLLLYPLVDASNVDYAIGIDSGTMWFSVPQSTAHVFKWYGGTTQQMQLTSGNLVVGSSTTASGKLYVYNTNTALVSTRIDTISALTSLQTSVPLQLSDYYNSGANGHQLYFNSTASTGVWEYNITKNWGGILTFGSSSNATSHKRDLYIYDSGQLRFANYTTTTSFTGTAVGVLAFTSDGSIITIATPGGGSGLTGSGTANYVSKFTAGTVLGNSQIFDNGTNVGINQASPQAKLHITPTATFDTLRIDCSSGFEIIFGGNNIANIYHQDSGQTIFFNTNAGPIYMGTSSGSTDFSILTTSINLYTTQFIKNANLPAGTGGTLYFADDYTSPIAARIFFGDGTGWSLPISKRNASTTTDLFTFKDSGQIQLNSYTTTSSFTGTAVGVLAFDASGNILTIATPGGGSSQWTTSGSNIYYTTGKVSIGTTSSLDLLHLGSASGTALYIRFNQLTRTAWQIGQEATNDELRIVNASTAAIGFAITANRSFQFPAYTAWNSFNTADAQGGLYFDTSGNIMSGVPPIYRITFTSAGNFTLNNQASALQFFNNQTAYIARADLTGYRRVRLHVQKGGTAGAAASKIILRYRTTYSNTTTDYSDIGTSEVSVAINTSNTYLTTSWINLASAAKADVFVALMMSGGDGSLDPIVGNIYAEFDF
jgi:hypothetical protein